MPPGFDNLRILPQLEMNSFEPPELFESHKMDKIELVSGKCTIFVFFTEYAFSEMRIFIHMLNLE